MIEIAPKFTFCRLARGPRFFCVHIVYERPLRAFVVLRPGFEETEENLTNLMESRLQDHERIRGGLFFIQSIPRDENWKVQREILVAYQPKKPEDCTLNVSAALPSLAEQVAESPKLAKKGVSLN